MNFVFHREALAEYNESALYYAKIDSQLALRFTDSVERAINLIIESPYHWRDVDDGIRRCLTRVFPYAILYSVETDYILIVAVMHCSREPGYWKSRSSKQHPHSP
jgi:plasmid stabilization system protein ParE